MATKKDVIFIRVKGLARVIWDPENDRMLAHFDKQGFLVTNKPRVITKLDNMGYRQVTPEEIVNAGLEVPDEAKSVLPPGKGYTHEKHGNPLDESPAMGE